MAQGTVLFFNYTERGGFGFITDDAADKTDRAQNVYFTADMIANGSSAAKGDRVLFDYHAGNSGKGPEARSVTLCDEIETIGD
jgi:cold shock CspA family protein